ncbi:MAG: deoxyribodipyrimidine photo-lyase, partial [Methanobacteriaceae archaeon]|nr:deoxyribodipyrimidine photo-lyase [Methanobacteriaceae archaeon]
MIQEDRVKNLNLKKINNGYYVLYWIQASPRSHYNHALEYAILKANSLKKPLVAYFGITKNFPNSNSRHYQFLLEGLKETMENLEKKGIKTIILQKDPVKGAVELSENAILTINDMGYLNIQREWREKAIEMLKCPLIQVETNVVVPVESASSKEDYSAGTIRRKIQKVLEFYMVPLKENRVDISSLKFSFKDLDVNYVNRSPEDMNFNLNNISKSLKKLELNEIVPPGAYEGGTSNALKLFHSFIDNKLDKFADLRNDPSEDNLSNMSPYLHFGQISPLYMALEVSKTK